MVKQEIALFNQMWVFFCVSTSQSMKDKRPQLLWLVIYLQCRISVCISDDDVYNATVFLGRYFSFGDREKRIRYG